MSDVLDWWHLVKESPLLHVKWHCDSDTRRCDGECNDTVNYKRTKSWETNTRRGTFCSFILWHHRSQKLSTPSLSHRCRIRSKNTRKLHMCGRRESSWIDFVTFCVRSVQGNITPPNQKKKVYRFISAAECIIFISWNTITLSTTTSLFYSTEPPGTQFQKFNKKEIISIRHPLTYPYLVGVLLMTTYQLAVYFSWDGLSLVAELQRLFFNVKRDLIESNFYKTEMSTLVDMLNSSNLHGIRRTWTTTTTIGIS